MMLRTGTMVEWNWAGSTAQGKITHIFRQRVERSLKGVTVTRNATKDDPAYLIRQQDGDEVLKSRSELRRADAPA